ncbi:MAG: 16S rRNA (cytosine(967)-C(5))-methyltransferase RsmB [Bacillota bacterium]
MDKVREAALKGIAQVFDKGAFTNIIVNKLLKGDNFAPLERRFLTELIYGTIRHKNSLEWIMDQYVQQKKVDQWIKYIVMLGIYQLYYLNKVPASAACNESVELAKKYGNKGSVRFVNGVLRNIARNIDKIVFPSMEEDPLKHISLTYSHPAWMVQMWIKEYGIDETIKLCIHNNSKAPNTMRVNTLKTGVSSLKTLLKEQGIIAKGTRYAPEGLDIENFEQIDNLEAFKQGLFIMQDEASMLVSRALNPRPDSLIVDGCAAPGTKTTHLAQLSNHRSTIIAYDVHQHKLKLISQNARRLGIDCIEVRLGEAQNIGSLMKEKVDYLLLDVPCSGLGVLRRRADLRWKKNQDTLHNLPRLQREILDGAAPCLKPGGVLVYSTCTINSEENIKVIQGFLKDFSGYRMDSIMPYLPGELLMDADLYENSLKGYIQLLPHKHNMDGFFISRIIREPN